METGVHFGLLFRNNLNIIDIKYFSITREQTSTTLHIVYLKFYNGTLINYSLVAELT
jgi:hypothetical protein